jgi:hypothetical protein
MDDLQSQAIGLLDEAGVHLDKIPGMAVLTGVSLFAATVGDDLRHNYMLHYWVCARTSVTYLLCFVIMLHAHWSALGQCYTYKATEQTRLLHTNVYMLCGCSLSCMATMACDVTEVYAVDIHSGLWRWPFQCDIPHASRHRSC